MSDLSFPIHKLCRVHNDNGIILAVTGTHIQTFTMESHHPIHIWPSPTEDISSAEEDGPPRKRLKSSPPLTRNSSEASIEFKVEGKARQKGERRRPKIPDLTLPHITHLLSTPDGKHLIALSAEDKAVKVFTISPSGRLTLLSSRSMPKKCCALTLTSHKNDTQILVADKFGDVYALPLHQSSSYTPKPKTPTTAPSQPSASSLTVHTKGNLEALKQQLTQKNQPSRKEGPSFEYKLLLGHVSLLTDLITANSGNRKFILTADRDEHIRVSRGIPQTHVIHTFCLGASEFVSKLFIPPWTEDLLIAGNGEPSLRLYAWREGREVSRFDIPTTLGTEIKTAVSGIWTLPEPQAKGQTTHKILLSLEGLARLFVLEVDGVDVKFVGKVETAGNVLDVVTWEGKVAVAVDTVHEKESVKVYRPENTGPAVQFFNVTEEGLLLRDDLKILPDHIPIDSVMRNGKSVKDKSDNKSEDKKAEKEDDQNKKYEKNFSPLGEVVYGLENLRKRRGGTAEEDDDDEPGIEV